MLQDVQHAQVVHGPTGDGAVVLLSPILMLSVLLQDFLRHVTRIAVLAALVSPPTPHHPPIYAMPMWLCKLTPKLRGNSLALSLFKDWPQVWIP